MTEERASVLKEDKFHGRMWNQGVYKGNGEFNIRREEVLLIIHTETKF
jgi:hypothetical protein